jgi:hypothetical protein
VERTVTINSEPKGALVYLNDKEVGRTPVTVPFEWYGDYDVVLRKEGYEPLKTHSKISQPWYEYIPIDIFSELLFPGTIHDDRILEYELKPSEPTNQQELSERALDIRAQARGEAAPAAPATQPAKKNTEAAK